MEYQYQTDNMTFPEHPIFILDRYYGPDGRIRRDLSEKEFNDWKEFYNRFIIGCTDYICSDNHPKKLCGIDTTCPTHSTYESYKGEANQCSQILDILSSKMEGIKKDGPITNKDVFDAVYKNCVYVQAPNISCLSCAGKMNYCINDKNEIICRSWCKILNDYWEKNELAKHNSILDRCLENYKSKEIRALLCHASEQELIDFGKQFIKKKTDKKERKKKKDDTK